MELVSRSLDTFPSKCDNVVRLWYFSAEVNDEIMQAFCNAYCLKNLIKQLTCFKIPMKPSCTDLILTNKPYVGTGVDWLGGLPIQDRCASVFSVIDASKMFLIISSLKVQIRYIVLLKKRSLSSMFK